MCLKGKSEAGKKKATHKCKRCGARSDVKDHLCKPKKIKKKKKDE